MKLWSAIRLDELLPYYYGAAGFTIIAARIYVNNWYWPQICTVVGIGSLVAGLLAWRKRRDNRRSYR